MFESKSEKLIPPGRFLARLLRSMMLSAMILLAALCLGILGYHFVAGLRWIDALLNASMILTGMGPVDPMPSDSAKLFASCYALFSGLVFVTVSGVMLAPIFHRVLHKFHLD